MRQVARNDHVATCRARCKTIPCLTGFCVVGDRCLLLFASFCLLNLCVASQFVGFSGGLQALGQGGVGPLPRYAAWGTWLLAGLSVAYPFPGGGRIVVVQGTVGPLVCLGYSVYLHHL